MELINKLVSEHTHVINLAAQTFVDSSIEDSRVFFETNIIGTHNILEAIRKQKGGVIRLIHVSTDEVWGESLGKAFEEDDSCNPRNPYAASKAGADYLVKSFGITYGVDYNIVHFTNIFGPWQYPEKIIPRFIALLMNDKKVPVYGDGFNIRSWLYISDAVSGLIEVFLHGKTGESYIVGGVENYTNLEITKKILSLLKKSDDYIEFVEDRPGNDLKYIVNCEKIKRDLGWAPKVSFDTGLKETVNWFQDNKEWLKIRFRGW